MDILWSMFSFSAPKIMQIKLGYNEIPRTMLRKQVCYKEITLNRKEGKGRNMVIWSLNLVYTAAWSVESGPLKCITNSFFPKLSTMNGLLNIRVQFLWFETLSHTLHGEEVRGDASPRCRSGLSIGAVFSCHPPLFTSAPSPRPYKQTQAPYQGHPQRTLKHAARGRSFWQQETNTIPNLWSVAAHEEFLFRSRYISHWQSGRRRPPPKPSPLPPLRAVSTCFFLWTLSTRPASKP